MVLGVFRHQRLWRPLFTLARLFRRETGLGFRAWRQQLRLLRALERIASGEAVTQLALELGYESPSAFIAMFRKSLGTSPTRYFRKGTDLRIQKLPVGTKLNS